MSSTLSTVASDRAGTSRIVEQATGIVEWMGRWNLRPGTTKVIADDAVFYATGSDRGSTAGDFKAAGCPLVRAGKMNSREVNGLALVRTMLQAAGQNQETPWLLWSRACEGLMATWPTLPRHPRDVERIADGCANHSLGAVRYGVMWWRAKWKVGTRNAAHPLMWTDGECGGVNMGGVRAGSSRIRQRR
jgi:hypothetical protein